MERRFVRKCLVSVSQKSVCFLRKLIAEYLGVTYRHLLYVLAGFVKRGIVKKTPQGYHNENIKILREIAEKRKIISSLSNWKQNERDALVHK